MSKTKSETEARSARRFAKEEQALARRKFSKRRRDEVEADPFNQLEIGDDEDTEIAETIDVSRLSRMDESQ